VSADRINDSIDNLGCPVAAAVVHHADQTAQPHRSHLLDQGSHRRADALLLVVGRHDELEIGGLARQFPSRLCLT
jgi:hypothetical protein